MTLIERGRVATTPSDSDVINDPYSYSMCIPIHVRNPLLVRTNYYASDRHSAKDLHSGVPNPGEDK